MPAPLEIDILPTEESDSAALAAIESAAFENSCDGDPNRSLVHIMFGLLSDSGRQSRAQNLAEQMRSGDRTLRMHKAVLRKGGGGDDSGKIVGWASWNFYDDDKGSPTTEEWTDIEWPTARTPACCNDYFRSLSSVRKKYISGAKCAILGVLVTLPEYQGSGVGSKLMQHGIRECEEANLRAIFLEASPEGFPFYGKRGFQELEGFDTDMRKYGGVGVTQTVAMKRSM